MFPVSTQNGNQYMVYLFGFLMFWIHTTACAWLPDSGRMSAQTRCVRASFCIPITFTSFHVNRIVQTAFTRNSFVDGSNSKPTFKSSQIFTQRNWLKIAFVMFIWNCVSRRTDYRVDIQLNWFAFFCFESNLNANPCDLYSRSWNFFDSQRCSSDQLK